MARSLTVKHEENLSISPLFAGFVLLCMFTLVLSAAAGWPSDVPVETPTTLVP